MELYYLKKMFRKTQIILRMFLSIWKISKGFLFFAKIFIGICVLKKFEGSALKNIGGILNKIKVSSIYMIEISLPWHECNARVRRIHLLHRMLERNCRQTSARYPLGCRVARCCHEKTVNIAHKIYNGSNIAQKLDFYGSYTLKTK
jgi:hypothetical protein